MPLDAETDDSNDSTFEVVDDDEAETDGKPIPQLSLGVRRALYALTAVAGISVISCGGCLTYDTRPVAQPEQLSRTPLFLEQPHGFELPNAQEPIPKIMASLRSLEALSAFMMENGDVLAVDDTVQFFQTYRPTPEELQANGWKGPCSAWMNFAGEYFAAHGVPSYQVTIMPGGCPFRPSYHHFIAVREEEGGYAIVDNRSVIRFKGNLGEYVNDHHRDHKIMSIVRWERVQQTYAAKLAANFRGHVSEQDFQAYHFAAPRKIFVAAQ